MQMFQITTVAQGDTLTQQALAESKREAILAAAQAHRERMGLPSSVTVRHTNVAVVNPKVAMVK